MMIVKYGTLFILYIVAGAYCLENEEVVNVTQLNEHNSLIKLTNNTQYTRTSSNSLSQQYPAYDHPQMIGQCGGIFRNLQNLIESPKFISARPICNLRCEYQIISPYICENEFHVQFLEFSLDSSLNCRRDRVIINYSDVLCGTVTGIKKYRTIGGVLNITFSSTGWDSVGNGFKLLITRLPCIDEVKENQTENGVDLLMPSSIEDTEDNTYFNVNASYAVADPVNENQHPVYGIPTINNNSVDVELNNRQDIPVLPLPPPSTSPIPIYPPPVTRPPFFLPQCCRNIYNQQRFLMLSQGFPALTVLHNDCIFVIYKSSPNACRLRIHFKYFLLNDEAQRQGQLGCMNNFIEIDGQRICGCKTNFIYETQWGLDPKVIRLRTTPGSYLHPQGFIFEVEQLDCPFKIQSAPIRKKRTLLAKKLLFYPLLLKSHLFGQHNIDHQFSQQQLFDTDENFHGKFFQADPSFINNVCSINYLNLIRLKIESYGILKHFCLPLY